MQDLTPDDPRITYSDYVRIDVSSARAHFDRIIDAAHGMTHDNPGARVRFRTDGSCIARLQYTGLHTHPKGNGVGALLGDGRLMRTFSSVLRPGQLVIEVAGTPGQLHDYELLMPYADSVEFAGLSVSSDAHFAPPAPRPGVRYLAYGDSITQGYWASDVTRNFPSLVAAAKGWQAINLGFGGRQATGADGATVGSLPGDVVTICMGANDSVQSKPVARFRADIEQTVAGVRAGKPAVPIYLITPLFTTNPFGGEPAESYRREVRAVVAHAADAHLHLLEGPELIPPELKYFPDGLHPNDDGVAIMAEKLVGLLQI